MNWDAVGAIGEIAGAATVIATLFYLALQVKHATSVARGFWTRRNGVDTPR